MSVPQQIPISGPYIANGVTKQFSYNFYLLFETDLRVFVGGAPKSLNIDYTVTGVGNSQGGNVVFNVAPVSGAEVVIKRDTPYYRQTDYADNGDLLADVVNDDFDRLWLALQEIFANFSSSISKPVGGNWDALGLRITAIADGTQPQDAVTFKQLTTVNGSASQSAIAAAASAVAAKASELAAKSSEQAAKASETNAVSNAQTSTEKAAAALASETKSKTSELNSKTSELAAKASENNAKTQADRAKEEADRAAASNPANSLLKANNLSDLSDIAQAQANLNVYSKEEVNAKAGGWIGKVDICAFRNGIPGGRVPADGQLVSRTGIYADLWAEIVAGRAKVVTEGVWLNDPSSRGCYSYGNDGTNFRLPDYNGVQPGSYPAPVWRGDGGLTNGNIQQNAAPNVKGSTEGYSIIGKIGGGGNISPTNPINLKRGTANRYGPSDADNTWGSNIDFDLSRGNPAFGRNGATEVRMNAIVGCWIIQYAGVANNAGSIDALALANRIETVNSDLSPRVAAVELRAATAWAVVSIDPTTKAPSILKSYGISSVSRTTGGVFSIAFQPGIMKNNSYGYSGSVTPGNASSSAVAPHSLLNYADDAKTTTSFTIRAVYTSSGGAVGAFDPTVFTIIFMGGQ